MLTQGKSVSVDDADFEWLNQWKWCFNGKYAVRFVYDGKKRTVWMHRLIMGEPEGKMVDHKDLDRLNNQRSNLRMATRSQNMLNRGAQANNTSGVKGVWRDKTRSKWVAEIKVNGRKHTIGRFRDIVAATQAYKETARKLAGEYARAV